MADRIVAGLGQFDALRSLPPAACLSALPAASDAGALQLEVFGATDAGPAQVAAQIADVPGADPAFLDRRIAPAQCAALDFVRALPGYPAFSALVELEAREVVSGTQLVGTIRNTAQREVHLLLVDNDGRVHRLDGFLEERADGNLGFAVPMTWTAEEAVETWQLLLAISDTAPARPVLALAGHTSAEAFFETLAAEVAATGRAPDIALIAFSVR